MSAERAMREALECVDGLMDGLAIENYPQGLPPGLRDLWAMVHQGVRAALQRRPDGAQGAPYRPVDDPDAVPDQAAWPLVGRIVDVDLPAGAESVPALVIDADATCMVLELRGGDLLAVPWCSVQAIRARQRACRMCGCTDERACSDGCCWVDIDLCSACEERAEFEAEAEAGAGGSGEAA